ncbi:hypothetical protein LZ32DRAFT_386672 [Colletotrichum eremochloae]|nr:hypothetical protein LZ32DRAFT_386672 [Colletotrichum eremochloae]
MGLLPFLVHSFLSVAAVFPASPDCGSSLQVTLLGINEGRYMRPSLSFGIRDSKPSLPSSPSPPLILHPAPTRRTPPCPAATSLFPYVPPVPRSPFLPRPDCSKKPAAAATSTKSRAIAREKLEAAGAIISCIFLLQSRGSPCSAPTLPSLSSIHPAYLTFLALSSYPVSSQSLAFHFHSHTHTPQTLPALPCLALRAIFFALPQRPFLHPFKNFPLASSTHFLSFSLKLASHVFSHLHPSFLFPIHQA